MNLNTNDFDCEKILKLELKDGSVSIISPRSKIGDDIRVEIETIEDRITNGIIVVPSNFGEYNKFLDICNLLN
ncbi:hypothetical protein bcCo53_001591 (plasmid) [Borrelia coriaceae]|nr:hypothetical protein [Borrelia coriaceae]UPA17395.1 hypothetical protein bcCo53_001591 [Borrelia coriaceae]